jgi:hypothetical protein
MTVFDWVFLSIWVAYSALVVGLVIFFNIIQPLYNLFKRLNKGSQKNAMRNA